MKHWNIVLRDGTTTKREWSLWTSDALAVGSHPRCGVVLPAPAAAREAVFEHDGSCQLPWGLLEVREDTELHAARWREARERIAMARAREWELPGSERETLRRTVLGGLGLLAALGVLGMRWIGDLPDPPEEIPGLETVVELLPPAPPVPPPPPTPDRPTPDRLATAPDPVPSPQAGGSTETRTQAWPPNSPASVMQGSVLDRISTDADGLVGEVVDPDEHNAADVILAGNGGHMRQGDRGGRSGGGDGDRMAAVGGWEIGVGGRSGRGPGDGSRRGPLSQGTRSVGPVGGTASIDPPRPTDIELAGEAGTRSQESILRVIRSHIGGFRYTYDKALRDNPALGGRISLRFTIAPAGQIVAIEILASTTGDAALDEEIREKARRMTFDPIERGNVTVSYAFVLDRQ